MAYNPVSGFTIQTITSSGQVASDYYIKFYEANTTTPLSMATDSTAATLLVKAKLNDLGMPVSNPADDTTVFIPHINESYRLVIYPNETDADNNTTANAIVNIPDISPAVSLDALNAAITVSEAKGGNLGKNLLINGDFSVNQEAVSGTVSLAAGEYGHDMWKAGASGCTYTFATSVGVTTITITAGTLLQIVEATYLPASDVVLSWAGTSTGRIDSGSYGASGTVTDTTTGGANVTVEFATGTLSHVQLEKGVAATEFEYVNPADQLARCQRNFERIGGSSPVSTAPGHCESTVQFQGVVKYSTVKRAIPSITSSITTATIVIVAGANPGITGLSVSTSSDQSVILLATTSGLTAGQGGSIIFGANEYIDIDARL